MEVIPASQNLSEEAVVVLAVVGWTSRGMRKGAGGSGD